MPVPTSLNPYSSTSPSASASPTAQIARSVSSSAHTTMQQLNQLVQQQMQQSSRSIPVNNGNTVFNAKYVPPVQLPQSMSLSGGWGPSGIDYELPKGSTPADRLRRALILASTQSHPFWTSSQTMSPAYSPGFVKDITKLERLKNMMTKDILTVLPLQPREKTLMYGVAIKMPGVGTKFTYMTFHSCPYMVATEINTENDTFFVPNNMIFVASQHKEFSIGIIPYHDEEKRDEVLKSVREFIDGFCEINIKPLMTHLVGVFMGNIVFLAPSKRVASLSKALFDVQYVSVMNIHKDWDIELPSPIPTPEKYYTPGTGITGVPMPGSAGISAPGIYLSSNTTTSGTTNIKWTNLQNSFTKLSNSMTSATNSIKNYFSSNGCSS